MMIGLDGAGKTTILHRLHKGLLYSTTPTIGFNVETMKLRNVCMTVWDVGGQAKMRHLWRRCWNVIDAVIYVIDLTDRDRVDEAGQELWHVLEQEHMKEALLLVLANKADRYNRMTGADVVRMLHSTSAHPRAWHVQECSAVTGAGLEDGMRWLYTQIRRRRRIK